MQSQVAKIVAIARASQVSPREILKGRDGGSCRNHASARAEEVDQILDTLPEADREKAIEAAQQTWLLTD